MRHRRRAPFSPVLWAALATLLAPAAAAQGPAAAPPAAPLLARALTIHVVLSRETADLRYRHVASGVASGPSVPSCTVPVGEQARAAYTAAVSRMFPIFSAAAAELDLEVSLARSGVDVDAGGWFAFVEHGLVLREASGAELARWLVRGEEAVVGIGPNALPASFALAAADAASRLDARFREEDRVTAWLGERGIELASRQEAPPTLRERDARARPAPWERAAGLFFVEAAAGLVDQRAVSFAPRVGAYFGPVQLQLALETWAFGVEFGPEVKVRAIGPDIAWVARLGQASEARLGVGLRWIEAHVSDEGTVERFAPSFFAALQSSGIIDGESGLRLRFGIEARGTLGTTFRLAGSTRRVPLGESALGFFVGLDWPGGW